MLFISTECAEKKSSGYLKRRGKSQMSGILYRVSEARHRQRWQTSVQMEYEV